ncbi:MAG: hypothetical protein D6714_14980 [Bacteroidetes bacterium]|nr:MAG: hypothetical protein D6714_14980 [Bacteroidota bacterium]
MKGKNRRRIRVQSLFLRPKINFSKMNSLPKSMIERDPEIESLVPHLRLGCLRAKVFVGDSGEGFRLLRTALLEAFSRQYELETLSQHPVIHATREGYKRLGKKPGRYRPSAEALGRRVLQGKGLYEINNVVDALNLVSVRSGFSIGGYDFDQIKGSIRLGRGRENEPYQAIGRGQLNIHNLPVLRDEAGAFGTPTSDSERTRITTETSHILMVFFDFTTDPALLNEWLSETGKWLSEFAGGQHIQTTIC